MRVALRKRFYNIEGRIKENSISDPGITHGSRSKHTLRIAGPRSTG